MLFYRIMLALMRGELAEAERLIVQSMALLRRHGIAVHQDQLSVLIFSLRREQGRIAELRPVVSSFLQQSSAASVWRPGLALVYLEVDQRDAARAVFEQMATEGSPPFRATGDGCSVWSTSARSAQHLVTPSEQPSCIA